MAAAADKHKFVVEYSKNCDGAEPERIALDKAIKAVVPDAEIQFIRKDVYPIWVKVQLNNKNIFENSQRNWFKKYPDLQAESVRQLQAAIKSEL